MSDRLHVAVTYQPSVGFVSEGNHTLPRSISAATLAALRGRITVAVLSRAGRRDRPVALDLALDPAAKAAEEARRLTGGGV
jgi:hypothetical protein